MKKLLTFLLSVVVNFLSGNNSFPASIWIRPKLVFKLFGWRPSFEVCYVKYVIRSFRVGSKDVLGSLLKLRLEDRRFQYSWSTLTKLIWSWSYSKLCDFFGFKLWSDFDRKLGDTWLPVGKIHMLKCPIKLTKTGNVENFGETLKFNRDR